MKKIFASILTLCLLCGTTALATEYGSASNNPETVLTTTLNESYTVVIPSTLNIAFNATSTNLPVQVTSLRLLPTGRALQVQVNQTSLKLVNEKNSSAKISYNIGGGEGTSARTHYFTATGTKNFNVTIAKSEWDKAAAGTYKESITFTVGIIDKNK